MSGNELTKINGTAVYIEGNDIDTDRIIPARYLKCVTFDELGPALFFDERFDEQGGSKHHVLDAPERQGASILISDANFGCGSSREHAPQAIQKFGFKAVIAGSFAEIFHGNSTTLGIPCVTMADEDRARLAALVSEDAGHEVMIDLENQSVTCANQSFTIAIKNSTREVFLQGKYDPLDALLANGQAIAKVAKSAGYV
ncbi:MAG: 3-isopropylmalate dehydratase small subunit [Gammaproteobacteria bacterium]|nr:3-isopropylmalate dehydratase small subunit [Gammaproteobacteria bacterium]